MEHDGRPDVAERIRDLARGARDQWWLILLCAVMALAGAGAYSHLQTDVYESSARVLIQPDLTTPLIGAGIGGGDPVIERATDRQLAQIPSLSQRARARPELSKGSDRNEPTSLRVSTEGDSNVVDIIVRSASPSRAALMAQATAEEYIALRRRTREKRFEAALRAVRNRINALEGDKRGRTVLRRLRAQARELQLVASVQTGDAQIVQPAQPAGAPVGLNLARTLVLGGILGLLLGAALAALRERLDRRIKTTEELEELLPQVPILAFIPTIRGGDDVSRAIAAESYHTLRASLQALSHDGGPRSILITSPMGAEGKSTTTANLALALKEHGRPVLILDADLRRPGISGGLSGGRGVSSVLAGTDPLQQCLVEVSLLPTAPDGRGPTYVLAGKVGLVPAGLPSGEPRQLFTDRATDALLTDALIATDTVLVDGPPLGLFSDMAPVASRVDALLIVIRLGHTRRDALHRMVERLATLEVSPAGMVVVETGADTARYGSYYGD